MNTPNRTISSRIFQSSCRKGHAFTLIELLVVIAIMVAGMALITPSINKFIELTTSGTSKNSINVAISAARSYAGRNKSPLIVDGTTVPYAGSAIIFTPSGKLRLVEHNQAATSDTSPVKVLSHPTTDLTGYRNISDRDDIVLPKDTAIFGIARNGSGLLLLTPPFAIRFNEDGQLIAVISPTSDNFVYYDANYDGQYNITASTGSFSDGSDRQNPYGPQAYNDTSSTGGPYNPNKWDFRREEQASVSDSEGYDPAYFNETEQRVELPFEGMETVIGIIVASRKDMNEANLNLIAKLNETSGDLNTAAKDWLLADSDSDGEPDHATVMFFSRYSGTFLNHNR